LISLSFFTLLLIFSAAHDLLSRRIPNRLTLLIALSFLPAAWLHGMPVLTIGIHAAVGLAMLLLGFGLFSLGFLGGGDAKLLGAAGVWIGLSGLGSFLMLTGLAGGLVALAVAAWSLLALHVEIQGGELSRRLNWVKPNVPYGYAIAVGAILALPHSWWSAVLPR
jgi:prepilin peptidase CpaA